MKRTSGLIGLGLLAMFLLSCGGAQKVRKAPSPVDSPQVHYDRGKTLLAQGNLDEALFEFKRASSLDAKFAPAYEGMAWVYLRQGDLKSAETYAHRALDLDGKWVLARLALARVFAERGKYDKAIDMARDALKDIPKSSVPDKKRAQVEAYLALGDIYKKADQYDQAQKSYMQVLEIEPTNQQADQAIKALADYKRAVSGQRPELRKIAAKERITRAEVAVLFVLELPLEKIFRQAPNPQQAGFRPPGKPVMGRRQQSAESPVLPPDVPEDHWARSFIEEALEKGVMELYPDGTFRPDQEVTRAEFAQLIVKFLVRYWNDPGLETRFFGATSPFADVNRTSPIFNAVMVVSSRNIIPGFDDGTFRPLAPVSGTEALNVIRRLKSQL